MKSFRNTGWEHFDKFQAIIPDGNARGGHAFSALNPIRLSTSGEDPEAGSSRMAGGSRDEPSMDVEEALSTASALSGIKRKLSALALHENDEGATTTPSTSGFDDDRLAVTTTPPTSGLAPHSHGRKVPLSRASASSSPGPVSSSEGRLVARRVARHSPSTIAMNNMHGSVSRLTDMLGIAMGNEKHDPAAAELKEAVLIIEQQRGLSDREKLALFTFLEDNRPSVTTFLTIQSESLKRAWVAQKLEGLGYPQEAA